MSEWRPCSVPTKSKLVYLAPATQDMEEIVKYHLTQVGLDSARRIYALMKEEIGRLLEKLIGWNLVLGYIQIAICITDLILYNHFLDMISL